MNLLSIRGGSLSDLENKQYNIGVGVSLGNKWFTVDNTIGLIDWSLRYSKGTVIVYVADTIHAINLEVRKRISSEKALAQAKNMSEEFLNLLQDKARHHFTKSDQDRIIYATWDDVGDSAYQSHVKYFYQKFESDDAFAFSVKSIVRDWVSKEERTFTENDVTRFSHYILEELPECLLRVPIKGLVCDAYAYPFDGQLPEFIESLQKGDIFPEIKKELGILSPKVFLVVR